jgi:hypothetical protein
MLKVICHTVNRSGNVNILKIKTPGTYTKQSPVARLTANVTYNSVRHPRLSQNNLTIQNKNLLDLVFTHFSDVSVSNHIFIWFNLIPSILLWLLILAYFYLPVCNLHINFVNMLMVIT